MRRCKKMPEPVYNISYDALISYPCAKMLCPYIRFKFLTANMLTIFRLIPAGLFYWTYIKNDYWVSLGLFMFTIFTGCLDGAYARMFNQTSDYGKKLNAIISKIIMILFWGVFLYKKWSIHLFLIIFFVTINKKLQIVNLSKLSLFSRFFNDNLTFIVILLYPFIF